MPSKYLIGAVALLALLTGGFGAGWKVHAWKADSANLEAVQRARDEERAVAAKQAEASQRTLEALQAAKSKTRVIIREIAKLEHPDRECLSADGVRLLNAAAQNQPDPGPVP